MRWMALVLVLALVPGMAGAEEWRVLEGAAIATALSARVLEYEDGGRQNFMADGRTLYEKDGTTSWGSWRVEGGRYCSVWPPSDQWSCYDLAARGLQIRFSAGGADTLGGYVDLN